MGHTAVLTSVADGFLAVEATLFQVLIRQSLRYWPSVFRDGRVPSQTRCSAA